MGHLVKVEFGEVALYLNVDVMEEQNLGELDWVELDLVEMHFEY